MAAKSPLRRAWAIAVAAIAVVGFAVVACSGKELRTPRAPVPGKPALVVMTYNLNYGLAGDETTLGVLTRHSADLVLLQETTPEWEVALRARLAERYPHMIFRHCCLAGGLGVLSRHPASELSYLEPPAGGWFPALRLRVASPLGSLDVFNVHLRPQIGDSGPNVVGVMSGAIATPRIRHREVVAYLAHVEPGMPTLIAGDFNESEDGSALERLEDAGLRSALPQFSDDTTWRWRMSLLGKVTRRFDHIVYSNELDVLSASVIAAGRSDHLPVIATFERK
jgi:endonuclease/exonuclease/phosphatase (EEP) superfamily protein YafD